MAINPPSDIVLDVARAADPAARQAAVRKLAGAAEPASQCFAQTVDRIEPSAQTATFDAPALRTGDGKAAEAYRAFEAFFIQSFIQSMLPKNSEANYGSGTAGEVWRSLSAEQMGSAIADAGGIGIAARLMNQSAVAGASSAGRHSAADPESAFSLASVSGAQPFQDWASYLPFIGTGFATPLWSGAGPDFGGAGSRAEGV